MAAKNKCLAKSNKSDAGGKATKQRVAFVGTMTAGKPPALMLGALWFFGLV
jgi:hypothetical protein